MNIDQKLLEELIKEKYINVKKHPNTDLYIYNYAPKTQYERLWNSVTLQCRGLILDSNLNIIARPFNKFFNFEEHTPEEIPKHNFKVFEKMDGSLGILYWIKDKPYLATRGAFESIQAKKGTEILYKKYSHTFERLNRNYTYLFEIIYPDNRIVVDYQGKEDLTLLATIDKNTGKDIALEDIGIPLVKKYDGINDLNKIRELEESNREGFVIKFENDFRVKVKFSEYTRLHKILTNISNKTIWEYLKDNKPFTEILEKVPDEFYNWVKNTKNELIESYQKIEQECLTNFESIINSLPKGFSRKEFSLEAKKYKNKMNILFKLLDKKNYSESIWKMIKPNYSKPFMDDE